MAKMAVDVTALARTLVRPVRTALSLHKVVKAGLLEKVPADHACVCMRCTVCKG